MSETIVVMLEDPSDVAGLTATAAEMGWRTEIVREPAAVEHAIAVFVDRSFIEPDCSWPEAVRRMRNTLPASHIVVCHGFSEAIDWEELADAGAFHALALPLKPNEVHQSLGFLLEAENRDAETARPVDISSGERFRKAPGRLGSDRFRTQAAG